jgi:hypothetical protein
MAGVLNNFPRDGNAVPITYNGLITTDSQILVGNAATVAVPIFTFTGAIEVTALYGVITTALGNNTAAYWRTNDGSTQNVITASSGTALTGAIAGGVIAKKALAATALSLITATSAKVDESATANTPFFQNFVLQANPLATSNIEFVYTTSDAPTTGAITFYIRWAPLATANAGQLGGNVTAL